MQKEANPIHKDGILVVDDTTADLQFLTNLLTAHGYSVYPASGGEPALAFVRSTLPDLVLLDVRMPGMDGFEVCRRFKADESTRSIPVIFIGTLEDEQEKAKGFQAGAVDYIAKPFQTEEVLARVKTHLRLQELADRLDQEVRERTEELATTNRLLLQELAQRRRAEARLRENEKKYRGLFQRINAAVVVHDVDTRTLTSNRQAQQLLGLTEEQMMGKSAIDPQWRFFREDGTTMPLEEYPINRVLTTGQPLRNVVAGVHRSVRKEDAWVLVSADPVLDEQGEIAQVVVTFVDITARRKSQAEHKKEEEKLLASEQLFRALVENSPDYIARYDRKFHRVYVNPAIQKLLGGSAQNAIGKTPAEMSPLYAPQVYLDHLRQAIESAAEITAEIPFRTSQGEIHWGHIRFVPEFGPDGNVDSVLTIGRDIHEIKENEQRFRMLAENFPDFVVRFDRDGRHTYVNPAFEEAFGMPADAIVGKTLHELPRRSKPEQIDAHLSLIHRAFDEGVANQSEACWDTLSGERIFEIRHAPEKDAAGNVVSVLGIARDITERKQAESRLNEQLHFLQQLLDAIPIPVYYKDPKGLYLGCNAAFEAFTSLPRKDIVGKTVHEVVPKKRADKHYEADLALLRHPGVQTYEISGKYKDGNYRDVIFHKATFVNADNCVAGTVGALVDITERKRAELERLATLRFFESMDKVNRAIQQTDGLERMMKEVLDIVLSIFDCDRAFLLYPCDPESATWTVPMERHKLEYSGVGDLKIEIPMDRQIADKHRILLATDGPVAFGPGAPHGLPEDVSKQFGIKSMLSMVIYPKTTSPWEFGIHQCDHARIWAEEEIRILEAIGRRLADGLSSLLSYRDLRKNEEFLDNVVEQIPDMIFVKDAQDLRFVRFNKAGERLVGYQRQELLGKTDYDFFPKEMADFFTAKDRRVLDSKVLVDISEETIFNRRNEERILHTKKIPILDETGAPQYLLGISEDITERKKAEASIRRLSQVVEQSPVSIVITDAAGTIEFVNSKFTQITGYASAEALGRNPRILKSGETPAEVYRKLWETIGSGGVWHGEFYNRKKNGEFFWEQATIAPVRDADNLITHYVAFKADITERKKLENQLRQAQKMEAVGQLAGGVAHDFNNMLGVIIGHAELALDGMDPAQPLFASLAQIHKAAMHSTNLTRQLLAFARKQTIAPKVLDLNDTVEGMLKMLRRLIGEDIDLAWLPGSKVWPVKMDPSQIDQILANLSVNARDAIDGVGKVTIETNNSAFDDDYCDDHTGFVPGDYVQLAVSDDGSGMDKPTMDKIFEPFFTTKEMGKGTGLGLATVYGIVKQNDGFINVYSEPGRGTTFKIYLPRHAAAARPVLPEAPAAASLRGDETILVVEDEASILGIVKDMLESYAYRVLTAATPSEAINLAKAQTGRIQLLLTDLIMPEMHGRDLAKVIVGLDPRIACLFMSGYTGNVIAHHSVLDEGVNFIQKPFSKHALAAKVREVLDGR